MDESAYDTKTVIIEKTQPNQGFGIAISGGVDNPHFSTGSTAIIVSDIVPGSPSDGLLKVSDQIMFVNTRNMNRASHNDAVQALRDAGMQARMVIRRLKVPGSPRSAPKEAVHKGPSTPKGASTPVGGRRQEAAQEVMQKPPEAQNLSVTVNGHVDKPLDDNKIRVTIERGGRGYGFAMGQLFYIRELAPNGPALATGEIQPGDRVIEINDKPLEKVKTLSEAIDLVLGSTSQISLLLEKNAVKPLPAARTPKMKKKEQPKPVEEPVAPVKEPAIAEQAPIELQSEPPKNEMATTWKSPNASSAVKEQERADGPDQDKESWRKEVKQPEAKPAKVEPVIQTNVIDSYASKWERERIDQIKNRRLSMGHEGQYIHFSKSGSLGIQVAGGNAVGIFTAAVKPKSNAAKAGLKQGDLILEANEIDFRDITREEAVLILLALGEDVSLVVVPKKGEFDKIKTQLGDNFFVRANFDHFDKPRNNELTFRKGEIFNVRDTMYQGLIGSWYANRVGRKGQLLDQGILPNKSRAEQLAIAQSTEERVMPKVLGGKLQRRGSLGGSLRRSKFKFTSQDKLDDQSFTDVNFQIPAYERVVLRVADFMRPVVILGPVADLARMLLVDEMPDRFSFPMQADSFGQKTHSLPRSGDYDKLYGDTIKFASIRETVHENKHCLLDLTPEGIEKLMFFQLCPIVILLKTVSKVAAKTMRASIVDQLRRSPTGAIDISADPLTRKHVKKMHSMTKRLEEFYPHVFTAKLNTHIAGSTPNNREWYHKMKEIVFRQQSEMAWMPEEKPNEAAFEDMDFKRPNYLSYVSGGESDTEAESVCSEPLRFEDFGDSQVDSPPRSPAHSRRLNKPDIDDVFEATHLSETEAPPPQKQINVYDEPNREEYVPGQEAGRNLYDTPYDEERREVSRTAITETVTVQHRETVESSLPLDSDETGYVSGRRPESQEDVPVLREPGYKLPPGFGEKPAEKKPVNAIKVYPTDHSAKDARQSLRRTEIVKNETVEESSIKHEIKQKGDSLRRVPADENPMLKDMDDRAEVKVSDIWKLEDEIQGQPPSRPPAPRNYIIDSTRDSRSRGQMVANSSYRPGPEFAEVKRVSRPPPRGPVEEPVSIPRYEDRVESVPNGYSDNSSRPPPPRDYRPSSDRYDDRPPPSQYRPPPPRNERPPPQSHRDPPPHRDERPPPSQSYGYQPTRDERPAPQSYREPPPRDERPAPQSYREPPPRDERPAPQSYREPPQRDERPPSQTRREPPPVREKPPPSYQSFTARQQQPTRRDEPKRDEPYRDYSTGPLKPSNLRDRPTRDQEDGSEGRGPRDGQYLDEPKVIATARGIFDHRGGLLESTETGVSVYVPAGALPEGKKQEIYFKVCQDNKYIPPLDSDGGETLLSPLVMCGPHGLKFKKPIELRLPHKGNSADGMQFSLKSSESPVVSSTGDPSKWKNVQLGGRDLDASRAYQVTDDTVSVLVDHF
ncbi:tight junction protein ZO-1-like isoform X1 [Rhopilema esculentum]|uniref:tight junction protein ZO-1-like isoform X1 n=1 Tax=Rhopilema esculentum TaxID=499914 RepID=UPI0031CEFBD3